MLWWEGAALESLGYQQDVLKGIRCLAWCPESLGCVFAAKSANTRGVRGVALATVHAPWRMEKHRSLFDRSIQNR